MVWVLGSHAEVRVVLIVVLEECFVVLRWRNRSVLGCRVVLLVVVANRKPSVTPSRKQYRTAKRTFTRHTKQKVR